MIASKNRTNEMQKKKLINHSTRQFIQGWGLFIVFTVICAIFATLSPIFLKTTNLINIVRQVSVIGTAAVGMAILMISGGIDLSVGSQIAFSGLVVAIMMNQINLPIWMAVAIALLASIVIGYINSFLVTKAKIPPLIATLGMMNALRGLGYVITGGYPIYDFPKNFIMLGKGYIGPIPIPVIIMLVVFIFGYILMRKTPLGRYLYSLGGNEEATRLSGIDIAKSRFIAYSICALLTSLAGLILLARINSAQPSVGSGYEMDVITAVVLGGVSISGGEGKIPNVLLGVLIIGVISNGLILLNVHDYYQMVIKGLTLLLAVAIDKLSEK